ncbi:MAG TPA: hypothetical protein VGL77_09860 [Armatimonadota bacterium]
MKLEERMQHVEAYFATVSDEEFIQDLRDAGLDELVSWEKLSVQGGTGKTSYTMHAQHKIQRSQGASFANDIQRPKAA